MKKLLCILIAALLACSALTYAESANEPTFTFLETMTTEDKLYDMLPVLDSLARNMGVEGEVAYDPQNETFAWTQVYLMGVNWARDHEEAKVEGEYLILPAGLIWGYATASFGSNSFALPYASEQNWISYDEASDTCALQLSDPGDTYIIIERYAFDAEGKLLAAVGLYSNADNGKRLGGLLVTMTEAGANTIGFEHDFPYEVVSAQLESDLDFAGLTTTDVAILYVEEDAPVQAVLYLEEEAPAYRTLQKGSRGEDVRALQSRLKELGYNCGSADGIFGSRTHRALRFFQDAISAEQDGVATAAVQDKLFAAGAPEYVTYVSISRGDEGVRVEDLQYRLRKLGYMAAPLDGDFGSRTAAAVKLFQDAAGLKQDGVAGTKTLKALYAKDAPECEVLITLKKGDSGVRVTEMQEQLIALGFLAGDANGYYNSATVEAVASFQKSIGMEGNGRTADVEMLEELFRYEPEVTPEPTVEPTIEPTAEPTIEPTAEPTAEPTVEPTAEPSAEPTAEPTVEPSVEPTAEPTVEPTIEPTVEPTVEPQPPVCVLTDEEMKEVADAVSALVEEMTKADAVKWIQHKLEIEENGVYDALTREKVKAFQLAYGFPEPDGIANEATIALMKEVL